MSNLDLANPKGTALAKQTTSFAELVRSKVSTVLRGKAGDDFVTATISLLNQNPNLKTCDQTSLVAACLQAQSLNLCLHTAMGQAWIVPFNDRKNGRVMATFQIGYKGYLQLAIRSGQYRKINVLAIKEGELVLYDPLNEEIEVNLIQDELAREAAPTIGYFAMFEYTNGFRKTLYWSHEKMQAHAERYSMGYKAHKGYTFWEKDFDGMAYKTMIRQLLSKWGVMSVEMQQALNSDMRVVNDTGDFGDIVDAEQAPEVMQAAVVEEAPAAPAAAPKAKATKKEHADKLDDVPTPPWEIVPPSDGKEYTANKITCPNSGKTVDEFDDCGSCKDKDGCPEFN